jgi:hypothetical protein
MDSPHGGRTSRRCVRAPASACLSAARDCDEQQQRHRLALTQSLVMAVLADPRHLDRALRQAADGLAHLAHLDS